MAETRLALTRIPLSANIIRIFDAPNLHCHQIPASLLIRAASVPPDIYFGLRDGKCGYRRFPLQRPEMCIRDSIKGSIEVGKLADMIVLSDDILKIAPMDIHKLKVDMTMIDGIVEYER